MQPYGLLTNLPYDYGTAFSQYGQTTSSPGFPAPAPAAPLSFGSAVPAPSPAPMASPVMAFAENESQGVGPDAVDTRGFWGSTLLNENGGLNLANVGSLLKGIGALGSVWGGIQANKIAKDTLAFQKDAYNTNLANSISSYNMSLEDRAYARARQAGDSTRSADRYIARHRLGE